MYKSKNPFFTAAKNGERVANISPKTETKPPKPKSKPPKAITENLNVKTENANITANNIKIKKEKKPPKRDPKTVKNPLTKEQKETIKELLNEWITRSNMARRSVTWSQAYTKLYKIGLNDLVDGIDQIEQDEFEQCKNYLRQRAGELLKDHRVKKNMGNYRETLIKNIHIKCKSLNISDEKRYTYTASRYDGRTSLKELQDDELEEFLQYCRGKNPQFKIIAEKPKTQQELREKALSMLLEKIKINFTFSGISNIHFDPMDLKISKNKIFELLKADNPALFADIGDENNTTFIRFWKTQNICNLSRGKAVGDRLF